MGYARAWRILRSKGLSSSLSLRPRGPLGGGRGGGPPFPLFPWRGRSLLLLSSLSEGSSPPGALARRGARGGGVPPEPLRAGRMVAEAARRCPASVVA